jgi:hypothetical protein
MASNRAAEVAKHRLSLASRRLGTADPVPSLAGLLDRTFDLPLGDPRYGNNALTPGTLPLEHSWSEVQSQSLRFDLEPLGPAASPIARRQEASREMRRLVHESFGKPALAWFDRQSETYRGANIHGNARFGAWFGAAFDRYGLGEAKVYYEMGSDGLAELPLNLRHAAQVAMSSLPGLVPIFTSIACARQKGAQRVYFFHRGDLRLLDLEPLMNRLGVGAQLPSLLTAVGLILGGRFTLPEGSVIIGLRDTNRGMEMKLDVLLPAVPDPPEQIPELIDLLLEQRPASRYAYDHWRQAMSPDEAWGNPGRLSVVSVRVNPEQTGRLTLYFRPVGYEKSPAENRRPASTPLYLHGS